MDKQQQKDTIKVIVTVLKMPCLEDKIKNDPNPTIEFTFKKGSTTRENMTEILRQFYAKYNQETNEHHFNVPIDIYIGDVHISDFDHVLQDNDKMSIVVFD